MSVAQGKSLPSLQALASINVCENALEAEGAAAVIGGLAGLHHVLAVNISSNRLDVAGIATCNRRLRSRPVLFVHTA